MGGWFHPKNFGAWANDSNASGSTGTDCTAALQAAIDAAAANTFNRGEVRIPAGRYRVTDTIKLRDRVTIRGAGRGLTSITCNVAGKPVFASESYIESGTTPGGHSTVMDLTVGPEQTDPNSHGFVIRDYYTSLLRVSVYRPGGDGVRVDANNAAGTEFGSALVENHYIDILVDQPGQNGFNIVRSVPKTTDSFLDRLVVYGRVAPETKSLNGLRVGNAAGWQIRQVHTYGGFLGSGVGLGQMWHCIFDGAQIESGWEAAGLTVWDYQQASTIDNVSIKASSAVAGKPMVDFYKQNIYAGDGLVIGSLTLVLDGAIDVIGVRSDSATAPVHITRLIRQGANKNRITPTGGAGAAMIRYTEDVRLTKTLADTSSGASIGFGGVPLPVGPRARFSGGGAKTVALTVPGMTTFQVWNGILTVSSIRNYDGAKSTRWVGLVTVTAKASATGWTVYTDDIMAAAGFTAAPVVTVDGAAGTLTVSFTPTDADGEGVVSLMSART